MILFLVTKSLDPEYDQLVGKIFEVDTQISEDYEGNFHVTEYIICGDSRKLRQKWRADLWEDVEGKYLDELEGDEREMYKMLYPGSHWEVKVL